MSVAYDEFVPCHYSTQKDLLDRLDATICRYDGDPVYVAYHSASMVSIYPMVGKNVVPIKTISYDDPLFDISMFECTYMNFEYDERMKKRGMPERNFVLYLSRDPNKNWKQGFCMSNTIVMDISGGRDIPDNGYINRSDGMYDAFRRKFPSFDDAMKKFSDLKVGFSSEVAISPDIALFRSEVGVTFVYYRTTMVGWIEPKGSKIKVVESDLGWVVERYLKRLSII